MLLPAIFANCAVGAVVAFFFVLYYINGEAKGKLKAIIEMVFGTAANGGMFLCLDRYFQIDDIAVRLTALASCYLSFLVVTAILLCVFAHVIRGGDENSVISLRDIFLGQYAFVEKHYQQRAQQINEQLNIEKLEQREAAVTVREQNVTQREQHCTSEEDRLKQEDIRINEVGKKKLKMRLPEEKNVTLVQEYITTMPSYLENLFSCITRINNETDDLLSQINPNTVTEMDIKTYLLMVASYVSIELFGAHPSDARVHFRTYNKEKNGYEKYVAIMGRNVEYKDMTFIPYDKDNMIVRSYECKRALLKSLNADHNYKSNNHKIWKEYLTYTFTDLLIDGKPFLSFGISIKNVDRFERNLHFINFFQFETFLQRNIEKINNVIDLPALIYGGNDNG